MGALYVVTPNAQVHIRAGRLVVSDTEGKALAAAPLDRLTELVIVGRSGLTVPALHGLLEHDVRLVLLNRAGRVLGRLHRPTGKNHPRRRALYARSEDPDFCLAFGKAVVGAKVANSRALAVRWAEDMRAKGVEVEPRAMAAIRRPGLARAIGACTDLDVLRGIEGGVARAYFRVLRAMVREGWSFPVRSRRPPRDPANALLSVHYSLLTQTCFAALEIAGLDPYEGLFHADKYGRPALALDLVEEFRGFVADSLMLRLVNRRMLKPEDFVRAEGAVLLKPSGWRVVLDQYAKRLGSEVLVRRAGRRMTVQALVELQAREIAALVDGRATRYRPFRVR